MSVNVGVGYVLMLAVPEVVTRLCRLQHQGMASVNANDFVK